MLLAAAATIGGKEAAAGCYVVHLQLSTRLDMLGAPQ
jgi:hypothetical protein